MKGESYKEFIDKFKPKLTTDDCYTPDRVYNAVLEWVRSNCMPFGEAVRPFQPGGDYVNHIYPEGCAIVDNPPFSIISSIVAHYEEAGLRYFLFAPHLTLFSPRRATTRVVTNAEVEYHNGATIKTSFLTNMIQGAPLVVGAPSLLGALRRAQPTNRKTLDKYIYPEQILTVSRVARMVEGGQPFVLSRGEGVRVASLTSQRAQGKTIFGGGFILSSRAAAEAKAAEAKVVGSTRGVVEWGLSQEEELIIGGLDLC